jgi:hypothetical protein
MMQARGNWGAENIEGPSNVYPNYKDDINAWAPQSPTGIVCCFLTFFICSGFYPSNIFQCFWLSARVF